MRLRRAPSQNSTNPSDQMNCPECGGQTRVSNTEVQKRSNRSDVRIRRFRTCTSCAYKFRTTQTAEKLDNDAKSWNFAKTRARGEAAGGAVFTESDIIKMRAMYSSGNYSHSQLATIYGCTKTNVSNIIHRRSWAHVS